MRLLPRLLNTLRGLKGGSIFFPEPVIVLCSTKIFSLFVQSVARSVTDDEKRAGSGNRGWERDLGMLPFNQVEVIKE